MHHVVVDSSVAFKWLSPAGETGCERALALLGEHRAGTVLLAAPTLLRLEVMNGYWKRGADAGAMERVAGFLEDVSLDWYPATTHLAVEAGRIAAEHRLTVYDALFVALAIDLDAVLVTDDRAILRSGACRLEALSEG